MSIDSIKGLNMKARSYLQYKTNNEVRVETIYIQNVGQSRLHNGKLRLIISTNEDNNEPRMSTNNDGVEQYSFNETVKDGAYCFLTKEQASIVKAMGLARNIDGDIWLELPVHTSIPDFIFNSAPKWE